MSDNSTQNQNFDQLLDAALTTYTAEPSPNLADQILTRARHHLRDRQHAGASTRAQDRTGARRQGPAEGK